MKTFLPFDLINKRIEIAKDDSDTSMFLHLMYSAEQLTKLVTLGLLSCVEDDKLRHRYSQEYRLVRADGIGEWATVLDEILSGPTSQFLAKEIRGVQKELMEAMREGYWQYDSTKLLNDCLRIVDSKADKLPVKSPGRNWFSIFARLRNKTRGHGAMGLDDVSKICPLLEKSINLQIENLSLFKFPWVYLKRNLSGKYKVSEVSFDSSPFEYLRSDRALNLTDGIYIHAGKHRFVSLIMSSTELVDFYFPNGGFGANTFECISYISDNKTYLDISQYLAPPGTLPESQTQGLGDLDLVGKSFTNMPLNPMVYIKRDELEGELISKLTDERHPVITLVGRGGIGKTSLAISVLEKLCQDGQFEAIIWLSARDIDLLVEGAKPVKPHVLTVSDIAKEFVSLLSFKIEKGGSTEKEIMERELTKSSFGSLLFVLDNFETVVNPKEVYSWLNTYVRLPNKILITSRFRDFKGDYPIEVHGMNEGEFLALVENVAYEIGLAPDVIDQNYFQDLFIQSDGHPYVAKILLGERLRHKTNNVKIVLAGKDDILTALFERTYNYLSPLAKRVFLTVSNWRSIIPEVAIEAVLLRDQNEPIDVEAAIEELVKSSLIESIKSTNDDSYFILVPLSASIFGKRKLSVDPLKVAIEADTLLLQSFGAGKVDDVRFGLKPRVEKLFIEVAKRVSARKGTLDKYVSTLKFICSKYHDSWLMMAELYEEEDSINDSIKSLQNFLETPTTNENALFAWHKLAALYRTKSDWQGEIHALVEVCLVPEIPFSDLSNSVNAINRLFNEYKASVDNFEKRLAIEKVTKVLESRISREGYVSGDDYSRLAWLYLNLNEQGKAKAIVEKGLEKEPENIFCNKIYSQIIKI